MRIRTAWGVAAVVAVMLVVGAVGLLRSGGTGGAGGGSGSSSGSAAGIARAPEPAGDASVAPSNGAASNDPAGAGVVAERAVVRSATVRVTTADPAAAADRATSLTTGAGGRVDQDTRGSTANLVLRVPADRLEPVLTQLAALGHETSRQVQGDDVTTQTADIAARVTALQTSVDRLRTLLGTSGDLADLLAVETQLTDRQADLESLQAQQRALAGQVELASIDLTLVAPAAVTAGSSPTGFGAAVAGGWHGFTLALRYVVAALGYALPVLVLLTLAGVGLVAVRRRRARRAVTTT